MCFWSFSGTICLGQKQRLKHNSALATDYIVVVVSWAELIEKFAPAVLTVAAGLIGTKLSIGRRAKQIELLDRATKELTLREAILKLKLVASDPDDKQQLKQIEAREQTYKQVIALEAQLNEQIAALAPKAKPDVEWLRSSTYKQKFFPDRFDGEKHLGLLRKMGWWMLFALFYLGMFAYLSFAYLLFQFISYSDERRLLRSNPHLYFLDLFFLFFLIGGSLWSSATARRYAYLFSRQPTKRASP